MNSVELYGTRKNGMAHGDVFTKCPVVCRMLDMVGYTSDRNLSNVRVLEPSFGEGEFLIEIFKRLAASASLYHFDLNQAAHENIYAYEIDTTKVLNAMGRIKQLDLDIQNIESLLKVGDFLRADPPQVDIVVGNPPYVRYEQLSEETIAFCKSRFKTFHYRADLYVPFYEKTLRLLKENGRHCFICSNRWLRNEYGKKLRQLVAFNYCLDTVLDMENCNPFQENVAAYTDIVLISNRQQQAYFSFEEINDLKELEDNTLHSKQLPSPTGEDWSSCFVQEENNGLYGICDLGLKIGIGVATGADRIYISEKLQSEVEKELLIPTISGKDLRGNTVKWSGTFMLNPYQSNGSLIDLSLYPQAHAYLMQNESKLKARHIAKKHPTKWYRTIDKIRPELQHQPKILLPDMSANTFIFVDEGEFYPSHNLYYVTGADVWHLKLLSAILISQFTQRQLVRLSNKMNGGFVRWQSQYLHRLRVPDIFNLEEEYAEQLITAYNRFDIDAINTTVEKLVHKTANAKKRHNLHPQQVQQLPFAE